jgi:pyrroline-5-carboxylate reductase
LVILFPPAAVACGRRVSFSAHEIIFYEEIIMNIRTIGFIGGGRIAQILLTGWQKAGQLPRHIVVSDSNPDVLQGLQERFPAIKTTTDNRVPAEQSLVFLALHPPAIGGLLAEIGAVLKPDALFISLAPKLSIAKLTSGLGGFDKLVRMIPNAPSAIGVGYNPVAFSASLTEAEKAELLSLFQKWGKCPEVAEEKLEAYAILTAMGPTYFWFQYQELLQLGLTFGLDKPEIETGLAEMLTGAVKTLYESGLSADAVMDLVPVRPLAEDESAIRGMYRNRLETLYQKLKG